MNDNKLMIAQDIFLDKINLMCKKFGLNNIMTQLYAVLYFSDKPLSLNDMVERLKISKGSASINIRALERYGVVKSVWVKGSRKDYYEAEKDIKKVVIDRIRSMVQGRLSELEDMVNASYKAIDAIGPGDSDEMAAIETFRARIDEVKALYDQASSLFNLFNSSILSPESSSRAEDNTKEAVYTGNAV